MKITSDQLKIAWKEKEKKEIKKAVREYKLIKSK